MRELTFIGPLSGSQIGIGRMDPADTKKLLLIAEDGTEFQLRVDERLVSVVTREFESTGGSLPVTATEPTTNATAATTEASLRPSVAGAQPITPREVQDRVRAGDSAEEIASETGAELEYVERFASQVLAECEQVIAAAAACEVLHEGKCQSFEKAVSARLRILGVRPDTVEWHALKAGHEWSVVLSYETSKDDAEAWFDYSLGRKMITPANEEAEWLLAQPHNQTDDEAQPVITPPVTTRAKIQTPPPKSAPVAQPQQTSIPARQVSSESTPKSVDLESSDQWDAQHPAAKALKRREAAQGNQPVEPQVAERRRPESRVDVSTEPEPMVVINQRDTMDETAQTSPEWEDLLFGSPSQEDHEA